MQTFMIQTRAKKDDESKTIGWHLSEKDFFSLSGILGF